MDREAAVAVFLGYLWLMPVGFVIGAFGTLIGVGGGFLLVPLLLLMYPQEAPETITSISLAVVYLNALSGSVAYNRMGRIDYRSGLLFAAATIPGAVLGALTTSHIPRREFDLIFGVVLVATSAFLFVRPKRAEGAVRRMGRGLVTRTVVEADGTKHTFSYNPWLGVAVSLFAGFLSSLLGIGGGIIHVPVLTYLLDFPVHIATATSQFVLAIMALTGTIVHIMTGAYHTGWRRTIIIGLGVLAGAQLGARLSSKVGGAFIIRGLAVALGLVGLRIILTAL